MWVSVSGGFVETDRMSASGDVCCKLPRGLLST
jgi:hypothetical protein